MSTRSMRTRCSAFLGALWVLAIASSPANAATGPVPITTANIESFEDLEDRFACYVESEDLSTLGTYNARTLRVGTTWKPLSQTIRRNITLLETPSSQLTAQQKRKLRAMSRREKTQLQEISVLIDECEGESTLPTPVPTGVSTATPRPTQSATATAQAGIPTPRPTSTIAPTVAPTRTPTSSPTRTPTIAPTQTPRPSATPTSAPQPTPSPGTRKNASMGMGLSGVTDYSNPYPYLDFMKQSRPWENWRNSTRLTDFDANGWPRTIPSGGAAGTVFLVAEPGTIPFDKVVVSLQRTG